MPNIPPADLTAFIVDDPPHLTSPLNFTISVHPSWRSALRHSQSAFSPIGWLSALARYPGEESVLKLYDGLRWGCSLAYSGDRLFPRLCTNRPKAARFKREIEAIIQKELSEGYRSGPFMCPDDSPPPLFNIKCHPRSAAVKKSNSKVRLVIDMSAPYDGSSVNANCPDRELKYVTLDDAGSVLKTLGKGCLLFKFDVVAAYKQLRLIIDDWCLQGETYTIDGVTAFDISTAAHFGAKSSGFLWEEYGGAFEFAIRWNTSTHAILRYVDDFLAIIQPSLSPLSQPLTVLKHEIRSLAKFMGVGLDKFDEGTSIEFLGILVDSCNMCFRIPQNKKDMITNDLQLWISKRWCTKRELDSLIGSSSI